MESTRTKAENFFTAISSHMIVIDGAPGTTPEYMETLRQLKAALAEHTDITREIIPLENSETNPAQCMPLSRALAKTKQTDLMISNFINNHCDDEGHPGALINHRMAVNSVTDQLKLSTNILKTMVHEYKKATDSL